jgi:hypothetical protein
MNPPVTQEQPDEVAPKGSLPLKFARYEKYARFRARMFSITEAGELAGFTHKSGGCSKAEARQDVRDRIAWLTHEDEEIMRDKLREIEEFYWLAKRTDISKFYNADRSLRDFAELSSDMRQLIEGLTFTEKGKPNLKLISKMTASIELRKLRGLDSPARSDTTVNAGGSLAALIEASMTQKAKPEAA